MHRQWYNERNGVAFVTKIVVIDDLLKCKSHVYLHCKMGSGMVWRMHSPQQLCGWMPPYFTQSANGEVSLSLDLRLAW